MKLHSKKREQGQGMTEYIIIVALIALAAIAAFSYFGQVVRGQTGQMAAQLAGSNSTAAGDQARNTANNDSQSEATTAANLGNFQDRDNN